MEYYFMTHNHNLSLVCTPQKQHRHTGKQETQGHGQVHPGDTGISTPSGTLTFLKDGMSYYLLSSLFWLMHLITWSSEFKTQKVNVQWDLLDSVFPFISTSKSSHFNCYF